MKKPGKAGLYILLLFLCLFTGFISSVHAADVNLTTNTPAGLQAQITSAGTTPTTITISTSFAFASTTVTIPAGANITLRSPADSQSILTKAVLGRHFIVNGSLTLENIILDGSTGGTPDTAIGGGLDVSSTGKLIINNGTSIQNCVANNGGGIYVKSGKITINDGVISGNRAAQTTGGGGICASGANSVIDMNGGIIQNNTAFHYGGGVALRSGSILNMYEGAAIVKNTINIPDSQPSAGGGMYVSESKFNMYGGQISDNHLFTSDGQCMGGGIYAYANSVLRFEEGSEIKNNTILSANSSSYGGGIYVNGLSSSYPASVIINGGQITDNKTLTTSTTVGNQTGGGGIFVKSTTLDMKSGTIRNNQVTAGTATSSTYGGGVFVSDYSTFTMANGDVSYNETLGSAANDGGGGVYVGRGSTFTMKDGKIIGNVASKYGGGIIAFGNLTLSSGEISGNAAYNGGGVSLGNTDTMLYDIIFTMQGGKIIGNTAENYGGGIYLHATPGRKGILNIYNGEISANGTLLNVGGDNYGPAYNGGGICAYGGATYGAVINIGDPAGAITGTPIINNNHAAGSGGGIYLTSKSMLTVSGNRSVTSITNNNAPQGYGGGIYNDDSTYANIKTASSTIFSGNLAATVFAPPADAETLYPNIGFAQVSISDHPLNNYDIYNNSTQAIAYHITYEANGGTGSYTGPTIGPGQTDIVLSNEETGISYAGNTFSNWNTRSDGSGTAYNPGDQVTLSENITLYAQWTPESYSVQFDSNGGSLVDNQTIAYGEKVVRPENPIRENYEFISWYTDNETFKDEWDFNTDVVTGDLILFAKWDEIVVPNKPQPAEPGKGNSNQENNNSTTQPPSPKTGDRSFVVWWLLILLAALAVLIWRIRVKTNKK